MGLPRCTAHVLILKMTLSEAFYVNTCMHSLSPAARDAPVIDRNRPNDEIREEDAGDRHPDDPHATV